MLHDFANKKILFFNLYGVLLSRAVFVTLLFFFLPRHYLLQGTIKAMLSLSHSDNPFEHENITMSSMVSKVSSLLF